MSEINEQIKKNEKMIEELRAELTKVYTLREALKESLTGKFPASKREIRQIQRDLTELTIAMLYNCNSILNLTQVKICSCTPSKKPKDVMYN